MPSCPYVNWSGISSWPDSRFQVARPTFSSASYGYKNSISIDAAYGFIRRHVLTPANIHDSQMLPALLDGENGDAMVWADSAYQSKLVDSFLKEAGYESRIHEKGSRHDPPGHCCQGKELGKIQNPFQGGACLWANGDGDGREVDPLYWFSQGGRLVVFAESGVQLSQIHSAQVWVSAGIVI